MFKSYLKTALKSLSRHKTNSVINIAGLMVGFAAFFMIFIVIQYEQSFDNFHTNANTIYRVVRIGKNPVNREYRTGVPFPVTPTLRNELPQLKNAAAIYAINNLQVDVKNADGSTQKKFKEANVFVAEPQFFKIFNFSLAEGNPDNAIIEPNTVLLTKDVASRYFDNWRSAMNKTIRLSGFDLKVTGILNNPPSNTDFPLSVVVSYATLVKSGEADNWWNIADANYCFIQLHNGTSLSQVNTMLAAFVNKHIKPVNPGYDLALQPLSEIHYDERYGNFNGRTFSKDLILALRIIGLFLLIIACVNFINLTTTQAIKRSREVGVRKVLGSRRIQLVCQFLSETGIITFIALAGALLTVSACLTFVNNLLDIHVAVSSLYSFDFILFLIGVLVTVTFLSGFYPALVLSAFKPVNVLKSTPDTQYVKGVSFRRSLVVFQFVIAQALIIGTLVVASQMNYFRTADMGFDKEAVINTGFPSDSVSLSKISSLQNELLTIPGIKMVSFSAGAPSGEGGFFTDMRLPGSLNTPGTDMVVGLKPADTGYFRLYNLPLVAGRIYSPSDTTKEFVVNEKVIQSLGIKNAQAAIGTSINVNGKTAPIVGVIKNYHVNSLRDAISPVVLTTIKALYGTANLKIDMRQSKNVIASMQNVWSRYFPDSVFEYSFLDQSIASYYKQEEQLSVLYKVFSGIAIFISCLGLYGLISFMAIQRKKEIGIRKVLGAPVRDIVVMLSKEFTILITVAFLIAAPVAWYFMQQWLQQYTYRIMLSAGFFITTLFCSLLIAWMTVGYTAIKAAIANPAKSLRTD